MKGPKFPESWKKVPLSACLQDNDSGIWGDEQRNDGNDYPVLRSTNIQDNRLVLDDVAFRSLPSSVGAKYKLSDGDILVTKSSGSQHLIGKSAVFIHPNDGKEYLFSNFIQRLRPNPESVLPQYLAFYLRSPFAHQFLDRMHSTTSGLRNLDMKVYASQLIPLPPFAEQRRIVEILSLAEEIRDDRRLMLEGGWVERDGTKERVWGVRELVLSLFQEMFGEPLRNSKNWKTAPVSSFCTLIRGASPRPKNDSRYYGGNVPRLMVSDLTRDGDLVSAKNDFLTPDGALQSRFVEAGTVVMAVSGKPGVAAILREDAYIHDGFVAFKNLDTSAVREQYLLYAMNLMRSVFNQKMVGATFLNLTTDDVKGLMVPIPPVELQIEFSNLALHCRDSINDFVLSYEQSQQLLKSLISRAFSGLLTASWRESLAGTQERVAVPRYATNRSDELELEEDTPWLISDTEDDYESYVKHFDEPDDDSSDIEAFFYSFILPRWRDEEPLAKKRPDVFAEIKYSLEELVLAGVMNDASRHWTAEHLAERRPLQRSEIPMIRRALKTLSEMGMIMAVAKQDSRQTPPKYVLVYRAVRDSEQVIG